MTFDEWLRLSDQQRHDVAAKWNPYGGEGDEIVAAAPNSSGGSSAMAAMSTCDTACTTVAAGSLASRYLRIREAPDTGSFMGIAVRHFIKDLPPEFQVRDSRAEYVWAPGRYECFVDRAAEEIRTKLGRPTMDRKEMLDALCGNDFDAFTTRCRQEEKEGKIPPYRGRGA